MKDEHLYIIAYDIRDDRRWRRIYKILKGYGEWLQLSVFQCSLGKMALLRLEERLREEMNLSEDHLLLLDLGPSENIRPKVKSIGKPFEAVGKGPIIV